MTQIIELISEFAHIQPIRFGFIIGLFIFVILLGLAIAFFQQRVCFIKNLLNSRGKEDYSFANNYRQALPITIGRIGGFTDIDDESNETCIAEPHEKLNEAKYQPFKYNSTDSYLIETQNPDKLLVDIIEEPQITTYDEDFASAIQNIHNDLNSDNKVDPVQDDISLNSNIDVENSEVSMPTEPWIYDNPKTDYEQLVDIVTSIKKAEIKISNPLTEDENEYNSKHVETLFVNYEIEIKDCTDSYAIIRIPPKGNIVRSYRLGRTKIRGYKEESFQASLKKYFGSQFIVSGEVRLNTGKETRPFEPDIAIIEKGENKNIRIDIEIDEPYAGITRQPTHCRGEDFMRDTYFVDRGWIVIRFSEYQIHTQEMDCLKFIASIIKFADSNYIIAPELLSKCNLKPEKPWDSLQAQKWEKEKFRERYLNHEFKNIIEKRETIETDFNEQELKEEKLVIPSLVPFSKDENNISYNKENNFNRDNRIVFYRDSHFYTIDNIPAQSVTGVISKFFPEFDSLYWAMKKAPALKMSPKEVEIMWKNKGEEAARQGSFLHEQIEKYYLGEEYVRTQEFHLFENFVNDHSNLNPFRSEWRIFDEEYNIAGTIDLIAKNGSGYEIYDWKRSKRILNEYTWEPIINNQWQCGIGALSHIPDTSYNRYCIQQSIYKYILEKRYDIEISKMYLVVLHPQYKNYFKIEASYMKDTVEYILKTL